MEISFKTKSLKNLCMEQRFAKRTLGEPSFKKLKRRYSDLIAAANVLELPPVGDPHQYSHDKAHIYSLDLHQGQRILFQPNHNPFPTKEDTGIDWKNVTSIEIIFIGDPHE